MMSFFLLLPRLVPNDSTQHPRSNASRLPIILIIAMLFFEWITIFQIFNYSG